MLRQQIIEKIFQKGEHLFGALIALLFFLGVSFPTAAFASTPQTLLYIPNSAKALVSLQTHANNTDIIAPETYTASLDGRLLGTPNPEMLSIARGSGARIMPLVVNQYFSQTGAHTFLQNQVAEQRLVAALIIEAKSEGYIGYQYDFEHMAVSDKDLYSAFVALSASYFHGAGLQFSVAVAPKHTDDSSQYGEGSWQNWTGVFDYAAIGKSADFISVMAYDDSNSAGPTAALPWVRQVISYTLARVPAEKVSLGIPLYAWVRDNATNKRDHIVGYPAVANLIDSGTYIVKGRSAALSSAWVVYQKGGKALTAWYEDAQSFQEKMQLVTDNKLQGFSAWALGLEDPAIWSVIDSSK